MAYLQVQALAPGAAGNIQQAPQVPSGKQCSAGAACISQFVIDHFFGNIGHLRAKGSAKPAAHIGLLHFADVHVAKVFKQLPGLLFNAHLAQPRTAVMVGDRWQAGGYGRGGFQLHYIGEKAGQLKSFFCQGERTLSPLTIQQFRIMVADHPGAGTRWSHYIFSMLKKFDGLFGEGNRGFVLTTVVPGLAATGLLQWNVDNAASLLQQPDTGEGD